MAKPKRPKKKSAVAMSAVPDREDAVDQSILSTRAAIAGEMLALRKKMNLNQSEFARLVGLSAGMVSKIEHGTVGASIELLVSIARKCAVPVTTFLSGLDEVSHCNFTPAGSGLQVAREGCEQSISNQLIGQWHSGDGLSELYLVSCEKSAKSFLNRQIGTACLYMLSGAILYRHGEQTFSLSAGDTLCFDATTLNGLDATLSDNIRYLLWRQHSLRAASGIRRAA
jgi:transcriptional regulator with XRE-family HTH domain